VTIKWGAWEYANGNGMRIGYDFVWSANTGGAITSTTAKARITLSIYTEVQYNYAGDTQTITYSRDASGSTAYINNQSSGTVVDRGDLVYDYTYAADSYNTSPGTKRYAGTLSGAYNGVTPSFDTLNITIPARPSVAPTAPTSVTATPGNGLISISFAAPTTTGTGGVARYEISSNNAAPWTSIGTATSFNVSGTNGTSTTGYVRAVALYGGAGPSASASATPRTVPSAPSVTATGGIRAITITFPAPSNGGSAITSYNYSLDNVNWSGAISSGHVITGLANGTAYTVYVRANNVAGSSGSGSASATTASLPSNPTSLTANASTFGVIGLSWTASSGNGYAVTYTVKRGGTTLGTTTSTTFNDTTVAPSTAYTYTVTASTTVGSSGDASVSVTSLGGIVRVSTNGSTFPAVGLVKVCTSTTGSQVWTPAQIRIWNGTEWKYGI
jgi:titin